MAGDNQRYISERSSRSWLLCSKATVHAGGASLLLKGERIGQKSRSELGCRECCDETRDVRLR